jgi:hypothetical protein
MSLINSGNTSYMSCSWLRFQSDQDAGLLYVDILVGRLIELQPATTEETDAFCMDLYPVLDSIQELCLAHNLRQVCTADLSGVRVRDIKPLTMMRIIWNVYEHTKNCILLQNCQVSGGGQFFNTLVEAVRGFLPPFMRGMITLIPDQNCPGSRLDGPSTDAPDLVPGVGPLA